MNLCDLGVLYGLSGALSSVFVYRMSAASGSKVHALKSAALALPLWPLWLPVLLASSHSAQRTSRAGATEVEAALLEPCHVLFGMRAVEAFFGQQGV